MTDDVRRGFEAWWLSYGRKLNCDDLSATPWAAYQAGRADQWQPIETAPKTSHAVLLYCPDIRCTFAATYGPVEFETGKLDAWRIFGGDYREVLQHASHWMPLPEPPK